MRFLVTDDRAGIGRYEVRFDAAGNATNVTIHSNTTGMITGNGLSLEQIGPRQAVRRSAGLRA